ncbi:MAG: flagellar motor protein MotB [Pseudomonadota bacterium]
MSAERPTLIKKVTNVEEGGHHGGAWKVAYADFVTAMMAFFLLLWLLNAASEEQKHGIADYFNPTIPLSAVSGGGDGMMGGEDMFTPSTLAGSVDRGVRPETRSMAEGATLGERMASPSTPPAPGITDGVDGAPLDESQQEQTEATTQDAASEEASADQTGDQAANAALAEALEAALGGADGRDGGHLRVRTAEDGLLIELVDLVDQPLFGPGTATPEPLLGALIAIVVQAIGDTTNRISVLGHTDNRPFPAGASYTNWELSADRANAARRLMLSAGLADSRIIRVEGRADADPLRPDPGAAENRRIAIKLFTTSG